MPKKIENVIKPRASVLVKPAEVCSSVIDYIAYCIFQRPISSAFVLILVVGVYLALFNPKAQKFMEMIPFDRILAKFKSRTMITIYAAVVEVAVELLMAVVLGGVSLLITFFVLLEDAVDMRKKRVSEEASREDFRICEELEINTSGKTT